MKKFIFLLTLLCLSACTSKDVSIDLPTVFLEQPETVGTQWRPYAGLGFFGGSNYKGVNDMTAASPAASGSSVSGDGTAMGGKFGLGILEKLDLVLWSRWGDDSSTHFTGLKYNFLGGFAKPGWVASVMVSYASTVGSKDYTDTFTSNHYYGHLDITGQAFTVMGGYKWDENTGAYLTVTRLNFQSELKITQTVGGTDTKFDYDDSNFENIFGVGIYYHVTHFFATAETTYSETSSPRAAHAHDQGAFGIVAGYIF
jgi:hypothetical protein